MRKEKQVMLITESEKKKTLFTQTYEETKTQRRPS